MPPPRTALANLLLLLTACGAPPLEPYSVIRSFGVDPASMACASVEVDTHVKGARAVYEVYCIPLATDARTPTFVARSAPNLEARIVTVQGETVLLATHGTSRIESEPQPVELHVVTREAGGWTSRCLYARADRLRRELRPVRNVADGKLAGVLAWARDDAAGERSWHLESRIDLSTGAGADLVLPDLPGTLSVPDIAWRNNVGTDIVAAVRASETFVLAGLDATGRASIAYTVNGENAPLQTLLPLGAPLNLFAWGGRVWWLRRIRSTPSPLIGQASASLTFPSEIGYVVYDKFQPVGPVTGALDKLWAYEIDRETDSVRTVFGRMNSDGRINAWTAGPRPDPFTFELRGLRMADGDALLGPGADPLAGDGEEAGRLYLHTGVGETTTSTVLLEKANAEVSTERPAVELTACPGAP